MERSKPLFLLAASSLFFVLMTVTAYYKSNGLKDLQKLEVAIAKVRTEIKDVRRENARYRHELDSLNYSNSYVEAIARENLGLVKPGEVVYEFVDTSVMTDHNIDLAGAARPGVDNKTARKQVAK
ncbi:hypothetical protein MNBD_NITROSPINAE02-59 [hydrothermal vent metagenome]|uniref:Cell division protein DivIC (FtsB), stabilizes FtsL against RasP cleavage n=1 Tax=hydrothermal vent metagenome TaxID=652676 RepID=A0A3B1BMZ5_9ZZZZ